MIYILVTAICAIVSAAVALIRYFKSKEKFFALATFVGGTGIGLSVSASFYLLWNNRVNLIAERIETRGFFSGLFTSLFNSPWFIFVFIAVCFVVCTYTISTLNDLSVSKKSPKDKFIKLISIVLFKLQCL